jgi:putative ABC transport system substrate-binding protein
MIRREFVTLLGGAVAAWPLAVRAQRRGNVARIGLLGAASESGMAPRVEGLRSGLRDLGYVEGTNVIIEYRFADDKYERLPELAADLVRSNVDVIVTNGTPGSLTAKQATATIPIVVATIGDPLRVVASLARPGGNITGLSSFGPELFAKRIELVKELMPQLTRMATLFNPGAPGDVKTMETTAESLKVELQQFPVRAPSEFENAFQRMEQGRIAAVAIDEDVMLSANLGAIASLATKGRLVAVGNKEFAQAGGLIGYGGDIVANYRRAAVFVDKILKGAKPADIPFEQVVKVEFILNLKTAKVLGLDIPPIMLVRADEVIE